MAKPAVKPAMWRPKIFYGWYVLGVGMLGAFLSSGSSQLFLSIMLKPMTEEFGWSRTAATGAITAGTLGGGLVSVLVGRLADRYGPRLLTSLGALAVAGVYMALASLTQLWQFYLVYVFGRMVATTTLSGVVPMTAAANWFRRMRGRALGMVTMSVSLGSGVLALVGQLIIEDHGWRMVFVVFALATIALLVLPAALFLRRRPEDLGLLPDGEPGGPPSGVHGPGRPREEFGWTLGEAVRTPALWLLTGAMALAVMANTGVGFHQVAYYTDMGIAATAAVVALSVYAFAGAAAAGIWGFLTERFSERVLAVGIMLLSAGSILYLLSVRSLAGALLFSVFFGLTSRGEGTIINVIFAQYYGRRSYGAIYGFVHPFSMAGLGLGPLVGAVFFDLSGAYQVGFVVFAVLTLAAAGLVWLARKPVPPARASGSSATSA